ncbi:MAG: response regulator, partial [Tunicatimonas sp.]
ISHEIRTPLTLISGYARRLAGQTENRPRKDYVQGIVEQSSAIKHLVDSIIDLSKLDEQKLTLNKTDVNLTRLLRKIHSEFNDTFAQEGLSLQLALPNETFTAACDPVLMNRAVTNLVTNALKFTCPNGTARLSLRQDETNNGCIEVYNTGIGIPPDHQAKIFERFYQVENDITRSQGSGIGLSMTQGIVESHGYRIAVESVPNQYALFTITIPAPEVQVSAPQPVETPVATPPVQTLPTKPQLMPLLPGRKRILLVEDNPAMREYIMAIEEMCAYTVLEARQGKEALELLQRHEVDLIITDYMMPHMDGRELVSQIKQRGYAQPVLVITAQTDAQYKLDMLRLGIDGYLTKPFLEEEFLLLVEKSLTYDEARRQFIAQEVGREGVPLPEEALGNFNQRLKSALEQSIDNEQFSVGDLCEQLHLTERTLFRRVKELCGCTPAKLITEARLMRAKTYYDQKAYRSTRQLARAVGFKNSTRFAEKFRERFGVDP